MGTGLSGFVFRTIIVWVVEIVTKKHLVICLANNKFELLLKRIG